MSQFKYTLIDEELPIEAPISYVNARPPPPATKSEQNFAPQSTHFSHDRMMQAASHLQCIEVYEHFQTCPVCSQAVQTHSKALMFVIGILIFAMILLFLSHNKSRRKLG